MDRFESMTAFVAAVEDGGFSAAARRTRMPLATISRKVSDLENLLGVRLINRSARGISLTETGQFYYAECRRLLDALAEAERAASGEYRAPRGELVITAPIVFGRMHLVPIVVDFLRAYPEVAISLRLTDEIVNLGDEQVDLAVRISRLPDSSMVATRIADIRHVVCASPAYLAERGTPVHPADLASHDCVSGKLLSTPDAWPFRIGKAIRPFPIRRQLAATTAEAVIEAALAGAGLARALHYQVAEAEKEGRLLTALRAFEPDPTPLSLVHSSARLVPLKLRAFLDYAVPQLKQRLAD
ncbi:MAG: LysR family transcriptional regulator [Sphingomonas sp.]|jgi:DNA-binding transcriptional LysR family regulator|uniref:LysR substrate-binding domain-containing protein n=1 Tax=Sphingomonas sp. TaxID=28214 RepID=UPI0035638A30